MLTTDAMAIAAMEGMLAHPRRYKPREQDKDLHWHDALATEAYDIAEALNREGTKRWKAKMAAKNDA